MSRVLAMSLFVSPPATRASTSISRELRGSCPDARILPISRDATGGASTYSPAAAERRAWRLLPCGIFEQVARGTGLDRGEDVGVGVLDGEHEHADRGMVCPYPGGGGHPVDVGHSQVHQHDVGFESGRQGGGFGAVSGFRRRPGCRARLPA